jgi:nitroreductase
MDLYKAIKERECAGSFKSDAVPKAVIEKILDAAVWAPNRFLTEPWRFWILTGEGRRPLSRILVELEKESMENPDSEENTKKLKQRAEQPFSAPMLIVVGCEVSQKPRVVPIEEVGAVNACIQNMLLALHAEGLEGYWKTPSQIYDVRFKQFFGLKEVDYILGIFYIGYPDSHKKERKRTDYSQKAKWIEEDKDYNI